MQTHALLGDPKPPRYSYPVTSSVKQWFARSCILGSLTLLVVWPSSAQKQSSGSSQPPAAVPTSPPTAPSTVQPPTSPSTFVYGRVLMEGGQPFSEPVSVALRCGNRVVQAIHPDLKGSFQFMLGSGAPQSNVDADMSAANNASLTTPNANSNDLQGGPIGGGAFGNRLSGCDVEVSVAGYHSLSKTITDTGAMGGIDVGTLMLTPIAGRVESAVSVTSLRAPNNARKEFDKAEEEARNNHVDLATKHLEKAVAEYDQYAAAWNQLGKIYANGHQMENARQAFTKAITADPQYIPPYVGLASLELQAGEYESAIETAGKALELHPDTVFASFIQAVANFKLNRLDAAEKSARAAENGLHQNIPQVHLLLADIFLRKRDYSNAAEQMRAYLKEAPQGEFAVETKQRLEQIEKSAADVGVTPVPSK